MYTIIYKDEPLDGQELLPHQEVGAILKLANIDDELEYYKIIKIDNINMEMHVE